MSQESSNRSSRDWRRQRRRGSQPPPAAAPASETTAAEPAVEVVASRTLFSFLEPALDAIGAYSAALVIGGVIALLVGAGLLWLVESMSLYGWILVGLGAGLLILVALISLSSLFAAFLSRTGRYGVNTVIMIAAFLGIIVVVNVISYANHPRIDVTATSQFSLSERSRQLLRDLDEPIRATAFYVEDPLIQNDPNQLNQIVRRSRVEDTLREFRARNSNFSFRFLDPDLQPDIARDYGITQYESVVIEAMNSGRTDIVTPQDATYGNLEQDLVTSLLVVTGTERKSVYYLDGHGERIFGSTTGEGYSTLQSWLEANLYEVKRLTWFPTQQNIAVPDDAALIIIASPSGELPDNQANVLNLYLQGKNADGSDRRESGRVILLAEPDTPESFRAFFANWGVTVMPGYIRDLDRSVPGSPQIIRLEVYNPAAPPEIVSPRGIPLNVTFMSGAAAIQPDNSEPNIRAVLTLTATSPNSYRITDVNRTDPITEGENADPKGPFIPAAYAQAVGPKGSPAPSQRPPESALSSIIVFGDSDFLSNSFIERGSGADFFLNSVNYLMGDYSLVSLRPKQFVYREFNLDQNEYNFVRFSSWFFLPALMAMAAGLVWWVRR